jgi:hypothetical protein
MIARPRETSASEKMGLVCGQEFHGARFLRDWRDGR